MKNILILLLCTVSFGLYAQSGEGIDLDLLKAPISPASSLLGFAQSAIDKPTDVSALMLSLQTASNSFTEIPANYAIDIAPYWIFRKNSLGDITTEGLRKSSGKGVFMQTFVLSFAVKNPDSSETELDRGSVYGGFGFKFSLCRGTYDTKTITALNDIRTLQKQKLKLLGQAKNDFVGATSDEIEALQVKRKAIFIGFDTNDDSAENQALGALLMDKAAKLDEAIKLKKIELLQQKNAAMRLAQLRALSVLSAAEKEELGTLETLDAENKLSAATIKSSEIDALDEKIKKIASEFQTARVGFTFDVAGGISSEFRNKSFSKGKVHNAGVWTTVGYTTEEAGSFMGLLRYLFNPDKIFALDDSENTFEDISTIDAGVRYIYAPSQAKFNASLEAVYRSVVSGQNIDPSWRLVFNADYAIYKNQKLTFSFGRNFDGTVTKDGNLIAALGFVKGFGNKR